MYMNYSDLQVIYRNITLPELNFGIAQGGQVFYCVLKNHVSRKICGLMNLTNLSHRSVAG